MSVVRVMHLWQATMTNSDSFWVATEDLSASEALGKVEAELMLSHEREVFAKGEENASAVRQVASIAHHGVVLI